MIDQMNEKVVKAIFETLPMEISVINANDEVIGWNQHETRMFKRPLSAMGMNFRQCHPEESLPKVLKIVDDMRSGKRNQARFWIDLPIPADNGKKHKILIEFYALRDDNGQYLGCMECTRDIEEIQHITGEKRLLDEI